MLIYLAFYAKRDEFISLIIKGNSKKTTLFFTPITAHIIVRNYAITY